MLLVNKLPKQMAFQVDRAVEILRSGGLVAYPTDTVYGLGADVFNEKSVERIYDVKQRPRNLPLPVLLADVAQVKIVVESLSEIARLLMERFWPGGLTLVLPRASSFSALIAGGSDKVAVRVPDHVVPLSIIQKLGVPIIGTSANINNMPSAVTPEEVRGQLGDRVDLIIEGGRCPGGLESTVVEVAIDEIVILRQGIISEDRIREVCSELSVGGRIAYRTGL